MRQYFLGICLVLTTYISLAQKKDKLHTVSGKWEELIDDSHNVGEIKRLVVDLAKINALENAFGKAIVQGTNSSIENVQKDGNISTNTRFAMIANTIVKGDWVETTNQDLKWVLREAKGEQELWLICEVVGKARPKTEAKVDFQVATMNCNESDKCQTTDFNHLDRLYLDFKTPSNGYLSVFYKDFEEDVVYRIFPYTGMKDDMLNSVPVKADTDYILFSENHHHQYFEGISKRIVDPIQLGAIKDQAFNRIFVVFSSNKYNKPLLSEKDGLKVLGFKDFQEWLNKNKGLDAKFQTQLIDVVIKK